VIKFHLVSNAHIDPVWQWRRDEGVGAAIATFSAAADFCEEFDEYIFCRNDAVFYKWIEEYAPPLFERIKKLVKSKKWHIMGAWYIQSDCNMPSGEAIVRQIAAGVNYFKEKFGKDFVMPKTVANVDCPGHSPGLVSIFTDAGYENLLYQRGTADGNRRGFIWEGPTGDRLLAYRISDGYITALGRAAEKIEWLLNEFPGHEQIMCLWGVGNHGGGASRRDIRAIAELHKKYPDVQFIHSTPDAFFKDLKKKSADLPVYKDLGETNQGTYSAEAEVKRLYMKLENMLFQTEKMSVMAAAAGVKYPREKLKAAETDLLEAMFHDSLPGTSIREVEEDIIAQLHHGVEELYAVQTKCFYSLASGLPRAADGEYPVYVLNPHPFTLKRIVECEFMLADQNYDEENLHVPSLYDGGVKIACQSEKESSTLPLDWRKKIVFECCVPPFSVKKYSCFTELKKKETFTRNTDGKFIELKTETAGVIIDKTNGLIHSYKVNGAEYLASGSGRIKIIGNSCDPWGFNFDEFKEDKGAFRLMTDKEAAAFAENGSERLAPVRIIEDGEIRTVIEALFVYEDTKARLLYKLPKSGSEIEIDVTLFNNIKDAKVKMEFVTGKPDGVYRGKSAFAAIDLKTGGDETVAQDYVLYEKDGKTLSVCNFGNYGSDCKDGTISITLLTGCAYSALPIGEREILPKDRYTDRMDQGERNFKFIVNGGNKNERLAAIDFESQAAHQSPVVLSFFPSGGGAPVPPPVLKLSNPGVTLQCLKYAEKSDDIVLRLYNSTPCEAAAEVEMPGLNIKESVKFKAYQFKSFIAANGRLTECNILEEVKNIKH